MKLRGLCAYKRQNPHSIGMRVLVYQCVLLPATDCQSRRGLTSFSLQRDRLLRQARISLGPEHRSGAIADTSA